MRTHQTTRQEVIARYIEIYQGLNIWGDRIKNEKGSFARLFARKTGKDRSTMYSAIRTIREVLANPKQDMVLYTALMASHAKEVAWLENDELVVHIIGKTPAKYPNNYDVVFDFKGQNERASNVDKAFIAKDIETLKAQVCAKLEKQFNKYLNLNISYYEQEKESLQL